MGFGKSKIVMNTFCLTILIVSWCFLNAAEAQTRLGSPLITTNKSLFALTKSGAQASIQHYQGLDAVKENRRELSSFYQSSARPIWIDRNGQLTNKAVEAIEILAGSWSHGINPERYGVTELKSLAYRLNHSNAVHLEILLSAGFTTFLKDLSGLNFDAASVGEVNASWQQPAQGEEILQSISRNYNLSNLVGMYQPQSNLYKSMRIALMGLLQKGHYDPYGDAEVTFFGSDRRRTQYGRRTNYTQGRFTENEKQKIQQLIVNMERTRWIQRDRPSRYIVVNTGAARLWAIDNSGIRLDLSVVVGKPERQTRNFVSTITGVRINPTWTVPASIKKYDFHPILKTNPRALSAKNIELYDPTGKRSLDPTAVNWSSLSPSQMAQYVMVQRPGDGNPLGRIRFLMPNSYNIFIHDTSKPELFDYGYRAYSSGCVRASHVDQLAHFVMEGSGGWSEDTLSRHLSHNRTVDIASTHDVKVYIMYMTVWFDNYGNLVYADDVYSKDDTLYSYLNGLGRVPSFAHDVIKKASLENNTVVVR